MAIKFILGPIIWFPISVLKPCCLQNPLVETYSFETRVLNYARRDFFDHISLYRLFIFVPDLRNFSTTLALLVVVHDATVTTHAPGQKKAFLLIVSHFPQISHQ